ncbi:MAG: MucR family transcriptional regulator [Alphaproteobacteria bacterium]|nr:MAG: MucR family transcriptional regulator [Alphaproteobacteria bacterium]
MDDETTSLLDMTVGIVANYVGNNAIRPDEVAALISSTYSALQNVGEQQGEPVEVYEQPSAAQVRRSITDNGLVSFIDGKTYQSLKRHLGTHGLTPADYRDRFGLKDDYPMVSPAYSAKRSELAKALGLGQKGRQPARRGRSKA